MKIRVCVSAKGFSLIRRFFKMISCQASTFSVIDTETGLSARCSLLTSALSHLKPAIKFFYSGVGRIKHVAAIFFRGQSFLKEAH